MRKLLFAIIAVFLAIGVCGNALSWQSDSGWTTYGKIFTPYTIEGKQNITLDTSSTIVLTAADCLSSVRINNDNDAIDYTLPNAVIGLSVVIQSMFAQVVTIDCYDGNESIVLDGTTLTAGYAIDSPGTAGDYVLLVAISPTQWVVMGRSGAWVDGGAN